MLIIESLSPNLHILLFENYKINLNLLIYRKITNSELNGQKYMKIYFIYAFVVVSLLFIKIFAESRTCIIQGVVIDQQNKPLEDVYVRIYPGNFFDVTDNNGHFIIENLAENTYQIHLEHVAYQSKVIKNIHTIKNQTTRLDTIRLNAKILCTDAFVVTAGRIEHDPYEIPVAVNVVSQSEIINRSAKTSAEALREESGIFVQKTSHGGGSAILRGLSSNQILILVDGVRLNNSLYRLGNHAYLTTVDNNSLQQIEVVRGPTSMQYGSDAMGGTINLRTQRSKPQSKDIWSNFTLLSRYATADHEKTISGRTDFGFNKWFFNAGFSYKDYDDLRRGKNSDYRRIEKSTNGTIQSPTAFTVYDFDGKLGCHFTKNRNIIAAYQFSNKTDVPRYDKYENNNYYLWKYQPQKRHLAYLQYQHKFYSRYIHSLKATLSFNNQIEGRHTQKTVDSNLEKEKDQAKTTGFLFEAVTFYSKHNLTYGAELYHDDISSEQYIIDPVSEVKTKSPVSRYPDGAQYNSYGFFLQDEYNLSKKWMAVFGGRYSYFTTQFKLPATNAANQYSKIKYKKNFKSFTFNLGTVYKLTEYFHLNMNLGQAFRAPNLSDLSKFGESKGEIFEVPNPDIEPEKMYSIDLGIKINHNKFKMNGSVYYSKFFDLLASADDTYNGSPTIEIDSVLFKIKSKQNIGQAYIYGFETSLKYALSASWLTKGNLTWTYGQNTSYNEPVGGIPPLFGLFGIQYSQSKFTAFSYIRFAAKQDRLSADDFDDPRIPNQGTPAWQTYNFRMRYQFNKIFGIQIALQNIFDYNYREHGSGINGPGRNFIVSLILKNN